MSVVYKIWEFVLIHIVVLYEYFKDNEYRFMCLQFWLSDLK